MMKYAAFFLLVLFLFSNSTCSVSNQPAKLNVTQTEENTIPSQRQLRRNFYKKGEVLVVYGAQKKSLQQKYESLLTEISKVPQYNWRRQIAVKFKPVSELTDQDIKNNVLFVVGTPDDNELLPRLTKNTALNFSDAGISFDEIPYYSKSETLSCSYFPNPENQDLPFLFLTGNDPQTVFNFLENKYKTQGGIIGQNMDYEIYRNGSKIIMGNFNKEWKVDKSIYFDYSENNDTIFESKHFQFLAHQKAITLDKHNEFSLAAQVETSSRDLIQFIGSKKRIPKITYHIYKTAEDKGLMLGNTNQAHFDTIDNSVHTIINEQYQDNFIQQEHDLIIHLLLGAPKTLALKNGLAIYFTKQWQREGFHYWSARLAESDNTLSLKELFDEELIQKESPLLSDCMSASLVAFLIDQWGKEVFLKKYKSWIPDTSEIETLGPLWQDYLSKLPLSYPKKEKIAKSKTYLKGFNFAHEGYSIYNGYLSSMATQALEKQATLGANATAIVPYSYIRMDEPPTYLPISQNAGSENDQGVIHSAFEAKKLGMSTMLKPQVFFGNSWPGALDMKNEKDWALFFDYYYRWIRHYALLAEIHDMDMLCMGVEFSIATLTHEEEWTKMFRKVRKLYHGQMTYAANWGDEFEKVGFWNELDFIGLNCYYPLSKKDNPTNKELKQNFESIKKKIETVAQKYQKKIVFTEIGFRSINAPWKNPHAEGDDSFNEQHQERCYDVVFKGIQNADWCNGILWWKFPTYLNYRGRENSAFTPNNKTTEQVVKRFFRSEE